MCVHVRSWGRVCGLKELFLVCVFSQYGWGLQMKGMGWYSVSLWGVKPLPAVEVNRQKDRFVTVKDPLLLLWALERECGWSPHVFKVVLTDRPWPYDYATERPPWGFFLIERIYCKFKDMRWFNHLKVQPSNLLEKQTFDCLCWQLSPC